MSTRPTYLPDWDTNLTNATVPVSALVLDGFPHGSPVASTVLNAQLAYVGRWVRHVAEGDVKLSNLAVGVSPWIASHAYALGDTVWASSKVYFCDQAGTSSTVAPSGTTTYADGTVKWRYVGASRALTALSGFESVGAAEFDSTIHCASNATIDGTLTSYETKRGATHYQTAPIVSGYGSNCVRNGVGITSSAATWVWTSDFFGQTGDLCTEFGFYIQNAVGTVQVKILRVAPTGNTVVTLTTWNPSVGSNSYFSTAFTPPAGSTLDNAFDSYLIQISGSSAAFAIVTARVGLTRP